eukprot:CAMPEP_0171092630 /NCGR_PEP_ID=MMETSP0766_2-20121228/36586_1 /TAXON_ID=439317 /ORGANISM="Gambierdiscus australes, Strain CAWD 149" /LENGTH=118 /DNA_ID=CAMNT_0011550907 /DNA_START=240 /DNA_END=592 /DNA_ORIENTATION=-
MPPAHAALTASFVQASSARLHWGHPLAYHVAAQLLARLLPKGRRAATHGQGRHGRGPHTGSLSSWCCPVLRQLRASSGPMLVTADLARPQCLPHWHVYMAPCTGRTSSQGRRAAEPKL